MVTAFTALISAHRFHLAASVVGIALAMTSRSAIEAATPADPTLSAPAIWHSGLVNAPEGVAIKGYDPVAYFTEGKPVLGNPEVAASLDGAVWHFTTPEHRAVFLANPLRYEPEYGGFCAYGAAQGRKTDIDPAAFSIIGGRLYLNADLDTRTVWRADLLGAIAEADRQWAAVKDQPLLLR
jgi:hypothetical protein